MFAGFYDSDVEWKIFVSYEEILIACNSLSVILVHGAMWTEPLKF